MFWLAYMEGGIFRFMEIIRITYQIQRFTRFFLILTIILNVCQQKFIFEFGQCKFLMEENYYLMVTVNWGFGEVFILQSKNLKKYGLRNFY